jgi:hypothetical protein
MTKRTQYDRCPECGCFLKGLWSGVKCMRKGCGYWFCF